MSKATHAMVQTWFPAAFFKTLIPGLFSLWIIISISSDLNYLILGFPNVTYVACDTWSTALVSEVKSNTCYG